MDQPIFLPKMVSALVFEQQVATQTFLVYEAEILGDKGRLFATVAQTAQEKSDAYCLLFQ